jgi:hypothetical protein
MDTQKELQIQLTNILSEANWDDLGMLANKSCKHVLSNENNALAISEFLIKSVNDACAQKTDANKDKVIAYLFTENVGQDNETTTWWLREDALEDTIVTPVGRNFIRRMAEEYIQTNSWLGEFVDVEKIVNKFPDMVRELEGEEVDEQFFYYELFEFIMLTLNTRPEEWDNMVPWTSERAVKILTRNGYTLADQQDEIYLLQRTDREDSFLACTERTLIEKAKSMEGA